MAQDNVQKEIAQKVDAAADPMNGFLTSKEAALKLHMEPKKLRKAARDGKITRTKLPNGRVGFTAEDLVKYSDSLIEAAAKAEKAKLKQAEKDLDEDDEDDEDTEDDEDAA